METRGQLQLTGALVMGIEVKSIATNLDYISVSLESGNFVELLGSNRIRLVFSGCSQSGFDLRMWPTQDTLHSFYVKDEMPEQGVVRYCVEMESSGSQLEIVATGVQVEIVKSTHSHH